MNQIFYKKLLITVLATLIVYILSALITKVLLKKEEAIRTKHLTRKWIGYIRTIIIVLIVLNVWLQNNFSLTTILGFTSAGLAIALNQVILDIVGWMLLMIKRPIEIGDRIEYKDIKGDVIDIRVFYIVVLEVGNWVKLDQSTGRLVTIPTGKIFTDPFFNFTSGFNAIWDEINILITFESDKDRAKEIIMEIANESMDETILKKIKEQQKEMSKKFAVKPGKLTPITYFSIKESGIQIELRYLSFVRKRRDSNNFINEKIYEAFMKEENIEFAYPSQKIYLEK